MKKVVLFLFLISVFLSTALSAQNDPRHPLSHIYPTDTDLNMSDYRIFNASEISLNDGTLFGTGLVFDDYSIRDEGSNQVFQLDTVNQRWNIMGASLALNGNFVNMSGGNIREVSTVNPGGSTVNTGGSVNVSGGSVTSGERMCIGDQCDP